VESGVRFDSGLGHPLLSPSHRTWLGIRELLSGYAHRHDPSHGRVRIAKYQFGEKDEMPSKSANVKNEKQYEALKDKGMSKQRAAKIANSSDASKKGGKRSGKGGSSKQGGTSAQKKEAGRKGGKAAAKKS
jgi:hypothetical protein